VAVSVISRLWAGWERWWFAPIAPHSLGLLRIAFGLVALWSHLALWPDLDLLFGAAGAMPLDLAVAEGRATRLSAYDLVGAPLPLRGLHLGGAAVLLLWTLGWRTRWTGWLSLLVLVSLHHRNLWFQHGGDRVLRIAVLTLAAAPAGAALSLDALRAARRRASEGRGPCAPLVARWPLRLLQLQWAVVYAFTGLAKLRGQTWQDGSALYYALSDRAFQRFPALVEPVLSSPVGVALSRVATWATLAWEIAFAPLLLVGPARLPLLAAGVLLHLGIAATISVGSFSFAMMAGYLAFLDPGRVAARWERRRGGRA
jgi:antimicrobial peptide system SdpB family protein